MVATEIADYGGYKMHINGIDEKDNEIINLLLKDARMSYSDIGEKIVQLSILKNPRR